MRSRLWVKVLKRVAMAVVGSLFTTTVWLVGEREWDRSRGETALGAAVAEADSSDPDWTWERLHATGRKPRPMPNGADLVPKIMRQLPKGWAAGLDGPEFGGMVRETPANHRYPPEVYAEARRELGRVAAARSVALTFRTTPSGRRDFDLKPDFISTILKDTADTREVCRLLMWHNVVAGEDRADLTGGLLAALNASRSIGDEPTLISQLVRIAGRSMATRSLERAVASGRAVDDLAGLQTAWAADAEEPLLWYGARGERAGYHVALTNMTAGTEDPTRKPAGFPDGYFLWLYRGRLYTDHAFLIDYLNQACRVTERPYAERQAAFAAIPLPPDDRYHRISALFLPALEKVSNAVARSRADMLCAVAGLACERHRLATGHWPASLAEIPKTVLPTIPADPFDDHPLRFRSLPDGVVIFAVGHDLKDDGGRLHPEGSTNEPGYDVGFRLWNPDRRGLPPVVRP